MRRVVFAFLGRGAIGLVVAFHYVAGLAAQEPALIPRKVLFGNPERIAPEISPDGRYLAYIAADSGVLNVWVRTVGKRDDRPVTHDRTRPSLQYLWQGDSKHILYLQDFGGDENYHLYQTDVATRVTRDLIHHDSVQTQVIAIDPSLPNRMVIGLNLRDRRSHDAYELDLTTGKTTLVATNPGDVNTWAADNALVVRVALATRPDGGTEVRTRDGRTGAWRAIRQEGPEEAFGGVAGFTPDNRSAWLLSSVDANAVRLVRLDLASGAATAVAADSQFDVASALFHPQRHTLQAVRYIRQRAEWEPVDSGVAADLAVLGKVHDGDISIDSHTRDDSRWLVTYNVSDGPLYYYLYDRRARRADFLFTHRPLLEKYQLARMEPISFWARDSMKIFGYLTLPVGHGTEPLPLVLLPHGGPWGRDVWGYDREVQWLANRGYAVLLVNFRGSTGFGKAYLNAGDREWAGKMQTDLLDAKAWAVARGYADPAKTCIYGGSYGGYATLVAVAFTPREFACAVDLFGPSNLVTLSKSIPPYWESFRAIFKKRMGDYETEPEFLEARSPLFRADSIVTPLMVVQGANDVRVKQAESDQLVQAMRRRGKTVDYIVFPDEGHGFTQPANVLTFHAAAEAFFARYLGGRAEPPGSGEEAERYVQ